MTPIEEYIESVKAVEKWSIGDIVQMSYELGIDLKSNVKRCYSGGNFGFIIGINFEKLEADIHFPARIEEDLKFIKDEWFRFPIMLLREVTDIRFDVGTFLTDYKPLEFYK